ncbi:signal peptidase I [Agilicoccus flavus]|uniref:signal peptidase I n=1 Tax=Agilicoccus flavus TaxID=2775968 RepID=UPI001CF67478|nr:signal peptidase I [Agilicoccus flavus]
MTERDEHADASAPGAGSGAGTGPEHPGEGRGRAGGASRSTAAPAPSLLRSLLVFVREVVIVVVLAVVLSLVAKTWLVQSFWIPSGSMNNTLVKDDRVMVSLLTPGPFDLARGDVVVFKDPGGWVTGQVPVQEQGEVTSAIGDALSWVGLLPNDEGNHLIKRVIGLPGDHVRCCTADGKLLVNDAPVDEPYVHPGDRPSETAFDVTVPAGKVWVMGDHRSDSSDSRFHDVPSDDGTNGSVAIDDVVGRAFAVVWPLNNLAWLGTPEQTFADVPAPGVTSPARTPATTGSP